MILCHWMDAGSLEGIHEVVGTLNLDLMQNNIFAP